MLDHRWALALLTLLLILAAAPLGWAWALLLPEERSPVAIGNNNADDREDSRRTTRDVFTIGLLTLVTISCLLKIPGMPVATVLQWLARVVPQDYFQWLVLGARAFFVVTPGLAAVYAAVRKGPLQFPLMLGGSFVVALWLASPYLRAAIQS
jgi:hypothetical protein